MRKVADVIIAIQIITAGFLLLVSWLYLLRTYELTDARKQLDVLAKTQNTVVMQMDESCYTQFKNNLNKSLYLKFRLGE